jgi:hypothetical protein
MDNNINITIGDKTFKGTLNNNKCVDDIKGMFPLPLHLQHYANHEYYAKLPDRPSNEGVETTSIAHAGGIYYFDGWNAFTIVYKDAQIAPYKVIHVGNVGKDLVRELMNSPDLIHAMIY